MGATGRIGTILRRAWPEIWPARRPVPPADAPDRPPAPAAGPAWQTRRPMPGPGWVTVDPLSDPAGLARAAAGRAAILCLSGVAPGRGGDMDDNIALALAALEAAARTGARVLLASSAAVYGAREGLLSEATPPAPLSEYGRAKAGMERRAAARAAELGVPLSVLRIGNVAGADAILGGWRAGFVLDRFADGRTPRRSYVGPLTLARVLGVLAGRGDLPGVLNLAAPGLVEMGALLDAAGLGWTPRPAPDTAIAEVELDVTALRRLAGFDAAESDAPVMVAQWRAMEETA